MRSIDDQPATDDSAYQIHILTTDGAREEASLLRAALEPISREIHQHILPSGEACDEETHLILDAWGELRSRACRSTRQNSPIRFLRGVDAQARDGPQPFVVVFLKHSHACAAIKGFLDRRAQWRNAPRLSRILPYPKSLSIPETCLLTDGSTEAARLIAESLQRALRAGVIHRVEIANLALDDPIYLALSGQRNLLRRSIHLDKIRWKRRLIDIDTGEPIQHQSSKTRAGFRRKFRKLKLLFDDDLQIVKITAPSETDEFVRKAARIVRQTYQAALGVGVSDTPQFRAFVKEMATDGMLRGYLLLARGEPISYVLGDLEAGEFHLWATSFVPRYMKYSPGILLLDQVMDDLIDDGAELFDFGDGEAQYKRMFGSENRGERDLRIYGPGPLPLAAFFLDAGVSFLINRLREGLLHSGHLDRTRKSWRRLLQRAADKSTPL